MVAVEVANEGHHARLQRINHQLDLQGGREREANLQREQHSRGEREASPHSEEHS